MYTYGRKRLLRLLVVLFAAGCGGDARAYVYTGPPGPTLGDVFDGTARFQTIGESEEVTLDMDAGGSGRQRVWDQKLPILHDPEGGEYYTFTRAYVEETRRFKIAVLTSRDGLTFAQKGILFEELYADPADRWTLYDAHVSFDGDKYLLTTECANREYGPSVCLSETRTPFVLSSWSRPRPIVKNSPVENQSASTGVSLTFEGDTYVTWTVVDDSGTPYTRIRDGKKIVNDEDGDESSFSKAVRLQKDLDGEFLFAGQSVAVGEVIVGADADPSCTSRWDCNNVDIQDWKIEGDKVYAIYNGSNYYRCFRPERELGRPNRWSIALRRADHPLGDYSESSGIVIEAAVENICGISYPVINRIGGQTYLYYSYYRYGPGGARINRAMRSRLIRGAPLDVTTRTATRTGAGTGTGRLGKAAPVLPGRDVLTDRIQHLYAKFLNRFPRNAEVEGHLDRARRDGYEAVVRAIVLSPEHERIWAGRNTDRKIESLYQGILDRAPDAGGSDTTRALIVEQSRSLDFLLRAFVGSPEFETKRPPVR